MTTERLSLGFGLVADIDSAESDRLPFAPSKNTETERCPISGADIDGCGCAVHQRQRDSKPKKKGS